MSAALLQRLVEIDRAARDAGHGGKGEVYAAACAELCMTHATLHRKLATVRVAAPRKRRQDAGETGLTLTDAQLIASYRMEHIRKNGKCIKRLDQAVEELRRNGAIVVGRVDPSSGEIRYLSVSAIARAMKNYGLDPDTLLAPDPVTPLCSESPNDVWQMDPSLCVIYKLPVQRGARIVEIKAEDYYKNKLGKLAKIEHLLVQRYVITDHASGAVYVHFGLGGESARGLVEALVAAMLERPGFPFYGAPLLIMVDQASANKSAPFRNLCKELGIRIHYTKPGNPRSKGQVEQAQNLTECSLESGLKMAPEIRTVEQLNELALQWVHWFNGTRVHSRHGMTRYAAWQLIGQVRKVGISRDALLTLAREAPVEKPVTAYLTVNYQGTEYNVQPIPGVFVGQRLLVCRNAWDESRAMVVLTGEDGREVFHPVDEKRREGAFQFYADAARILDGDYKRFEDTPAQTARKELELLATGAETLSDAEKARKAQAVPFGGEINPYKEMQEYQPPQYFPNRGSDVPVVSPRVEVPPLTHAQALIRLRNVLGRSLAAEENAWVTRRYPDGVPEEAMDGLIAQFGSAGAEVEAPRGGLQVVR